MRIFSSPSPQEETDHPELKTAKNTYNQKFQHINIEYFSGLTKRLLDSMYPKFCQKCESKMTAEISTRENAIRCPKCHTQGSRTSYTPLHHLKIPMWTFSYIFIESLQMYPAVLSSSAIKLRLGVSKNTATLLKRRLQLFLTDLQPAIKNIMAEDINSEFKDYQFPEDLAKDLSEAIKGKPVVNMDTVALFSARERSNGFRSRYKHTGQTASIYLSDKVAEEKGKYQVGTLCHTIGIKQGGVILDSIPDQKQKTILPLLDFLPRHAPTFTDQGYPWLKRYNFNHRAVNHSARAKDKKRNVWAKDRWSKNGINNQVAEGFQRILKHSFITGYSYITPEYSQLYLNEYSAIKSIRSYGMDRILAISESINASISASIKNSHGTTCVEYGPETIAAPQSRRRNQIILISSV